MSTTSQLVRADAPTIALAVTATASAAVGLPAVGSSIRLVNEGPSNCYIAITPNPGQLAVLPAAGVNTALCTPVLAGTDITLGIPPDARLMISAICRAALTTTLLFSVSDGA